MKPEAAETRRYHHGDLRRALVCAARRLVETDGPAALSLRAVAREAGVSPAAPYHHFKDKGELLEAVADESWDLLNQQMTAAKADQSSIRDKLTALGVAYVRFARDNPALYRIMYDRTRDQADLPGHVLAKTDSAYCQVRDTLAEAGVATEDAQEIELATIAAWCAAHGLAEMFAFKQFDHMKADLGGDEAFLSAVFQHMGIFAHPGDE